MLATILPDIIPKMLTLRIIKHVAEAWAVIQYICSYVSHLIIVTVQDCLTL